LDVTTGSVGSTGPSDGRVSEPSAAPNRLNVTLVESFRIGGHVRVGRGATTWRSIVDEQAAVTSAS
jgi:hypothetical protein